MPSWTKEQYEQWESRQNSGVAPSAQPERAVQNEPMEKASGEAGHPRRIAVRFTVFRHRLLDPDNICIKYFLDGVKYAGLIPDDSPDKITLEVLQEKVTLKSDERTVIEIYERLDKDNPNQQMPHL